MNRIMKQMGQVIKVKKATITKPRAPTPRRIEQMRPESEPRSKIWWPGFLEADQVYLLHDLYLDSLAKGPPSIFDRWRR